MFGKEEFFLIIAVSLLLTMLLYVMFHNVAYKNVYKRFKQYDRQRYGFYECGFRPKHDISAEVNLYTYVMLALVILYDVEGVFLLFFATVLDSMCLAGVLIIVFYLATLLFGLWVELASSSTDWLFY